MCWIQQRRCLQLSSNVIHWPHDYTFQPYWYLRVIVWIKKLVLRELHFSNNRFVYELILFIHPHIQYNTFIMCTGHSVNFIYICDFTYLSHCVHNSGVFRIVNFNFLSICSPYAYTYSHKNRELIFCELCFRAFFPLSVLTIVYYINKGVPPGEGGGTETYWLCRYVW